ncbi:hypothetical protein WR164_05350 [Philodulcilactobacillus myokoensis]|uniref:Peptidase S11 D-alanyl-D-alanine carboxypeptidase A N-terminal domain-containing protein n=1 Tax=Philodulcilactobacillus myokoensis TaxID=2929573 RepID=A0A9W6B0K8_9LACO|nr:serine hydrolase [Philodulcilactobacillus myokoensis]GLB46556.1 hypothetical protein WR164_05350 [Philodulcilactobacillus myokoensis]
MKVNQLIKRCLLVGVAVLGIGGSVGLNNQPINASAKSFRLHFHRGYRMQSIKKRDLISDNYNVKHARAAVAMDANTGNVVYNKNGDKRMKIASVAKLMTLYLVAQKAQSINNGWNQQVNTSNAGLKRMSYNSTLNGGFKFKRNHYSVKQLFRAALVGSSNNSAIALGQWVSGSNKSFIKAMNRQAKAWNLNASFVSASGLENNDLARYGFWAKGGYYAGNEVSANSVATIARNVLNEYPSIVNDAKRLSIKVAGQRLTNVNSLLNGGRLSHFSKGLYIDGLKTGYTGPAGLCFVGTSQKPGKDRMITVVLHDDYEFTDTTSLMQHLYSTSDAFN